MTATTLLYCILAILIVNFLKDKILNALNARHFNDALPKPIADVYDVKAYKKSQRYKTANYRFGLLSSSLSFAVTLVVLLADGFEYIDQLARQYTTNPIVLALLFFGIISLASTLFSLPFSYYKTFVIEEQFGFNTSTKRLFFLDALKGLVMSAVLGGIIMALLVWFYQLTTQHFWLYAWALITAFTVFMNVFYAKLIVPLFNTQTPLPIGTLRHKISEYATSVGFNLDNIFIIDGSKRSTKANAYFSGFGREKRITLYDTLVNDLSDEEIVAVLAHEVGHYKKKHIITNLFSSIALTGVTLYILSIFIGNPLLSNAIGVSIPSFHAGLVAFGLLYAPISEITGLVMHYISRRFEYQADNYAKHTYKAEPLISALKTLNQKSLSNLTPHKAYVFMHYSHPTLLQRIKNLEAN